MTVKTVIFLWDEIFLIAQDDEYLGEAWQFIEKWRFSSSFFIASCK